MGRFWLPMLPVEMRSRSPALFRARLCALVAALWLVSTAAIAADDPRLTPSRALVERFAAELREALGAAMAGSRPVAAIEVCRDRAPLIASRLARESGARIGRTSLELRNPGNAPEPWQRTVLEQFRTSSTPASPAEHSEPDGSGGFRYMKAIHIDGPCLTCHGSSIDPALAGKLAQDYPHDAARGYQPGDLRGAFSVSWPAAP